MALLLLSQRAKKNQHRLVRRIAFLTLWYLLPAGGLALFFLTTGLNDRIGLARREFDGVKYIAQAMNVHDAAASEMWQWERSAGRPENLEAELLALRRFQEAGTDPIAQKLFVSWEEIRADSDDRARRTELLSAFIAQLHMLIAARSDSSSLTISPELETNYLTDIIAFALPVHLERLLQLHEQMVTAEAAPGHSLLGAVYARLLDQEDLKRVTRSTEAAIQGDFKSAHAAKRFQSEFPPAGAAFLESLRQFSTAISPSRSAALTPEAFDALFRDAYAAADRFWRTSAEQLQVLLADQIEYDQRKRNLALFIALGVIVGLLPLSWFYVRGYVRPVVLDLVNEVREVADAEARAKNQFLAMMSHEIRTPMNGVIGFANLLADTPLDDQQQDFVRTITSSGESLLAIINDILDLSKLEADRTELESRPVILQDLVEEVMDLVSPPARAKQIELIYWIEPELPPAIMGDGTRLRQVLLNLVGNAVKFTDTGHVEVSVSASDESLGLDLRRIKFSVRDTGTGIPSDRLDRLFKPFSQVDSSITRTHGGTGLGLAICHRLVGLMGSSIIVQSELGKGSEFSFTIAAKAIELLPVTPDRGPALAGKEILIVDDYPANRRLFANLLERYDARPTTAGSGLEALGIMAGKRFDLVVLDYVMPIQNGIELAKSIRAEIADTPLILVTSVLLAAADIPEGLFAAVITKPVKSSRFTASVARALFDREALAAPLPVAARPPAPALTHPLRILAVDDNPVNLRVISMMLTSMGYAPAVANNGIKALEQLRTGKFDLVIMDVQMPDLDGHEATRQLRAGVAGELNRFVRVLALTAGTTAEERSASQAAGMDDFIAKPVTRQALLEKLVATV